MLPPSFYFISCLLLSNGTAYCKCAAGFEGNGTFCTGKWTLFLPFWKINKKETKEEGLKHSLVTVELVRDEHFPVHQLKNRNCCQFTQNKQQPSRCRRSKQRAPNLQVVRHCAEGTREKGTCCAQPLPHCLQSNKTWFGTFTPFPSKAQRREANSGYSNTSSYWKLCNYLCATLPFPQLSDLAQISGVVKSVSLD